MNRSVPESDSMVMSGLGKPDPPISCSVTHASAKLYWGANPRSFAERTNLKGLRRAGVQSHIFSIVYTGYAQRHVCNLQT